MRKGKIYGGICILTLFLILVIPFSLGFGILPASKSFEYSEKDQKGSFKIILSPGEESKRFVVHVEGELKDYIEVKKSVFDLGTSKREGVVEYVIKEPKDLKPGKLEGKIIVLEVPLREEGSEQNPIVTATASLIHKVVVYKPYPTEYIEVIPYVTNGKENEATIRLDIYNRGKKPSYVRGEVKILGPLNEEVDTIMIESTKIEEGKMKSLSFKWDAPNPGNYFAKVNLVYSNNKIVEVTKPFKVLGSALQIMGLEVLNFKLGEIAKIVLKVKSNWNKPLENIFGEVEVIDNNGNKVMHIQTLPFSIQPLEVKDVEAYWDTTGINIGSYILKVNFDVLDTNIERLFNVNVGLDSAKVVSGDVPTAKVVSANETEKEGSSNILQLIVGVIIVLVIMNIVFFFYIIKKLNAKK